MNHEFAAQTTPHVQAQITNKSVFWGKIFPYFVVSRFIVAVFVYIGHTWKIYLEAPIGNKWVGVPYWHLNPWTNWDAQWFLEIAQHGYEHPMTRAFFPLYPFLLSLSPSQSDVGIALTGVIISNLCFLFSLFFLFQLAKRMGGEATADRALFFFCFFPTTAFFSAVYSESLFFLLSTSSFYFAHQRKWLAAGILASLAALTRNTGFILAPALLCEYFLNQPRPLKLKQTLREAGVLLLPLAGFIGVMLFFSSVSGDLAEGIQVQRLYGRVWDWPWVPISKEVDYLYWRFSAYYQPQAWNILCFVNFAGLLIAIFLVIKKASRFYLPYTVYMLPILIMHLCYTKIFDPYTGGSLRYIAVTFPYTLLFAAQFSSSKKMHTPSRVKALAYIALCCYFSFYFGQKYFLG